MDAWIPYVAGFFDGEGSVTIARVRTGGYSDYHKIVVAIGQRAKYGAILNRIQESFGGTVAIGSQKHRLADRWAEHAHWQLQRKSEIERFLMALQPYCVVKAKQIELGLEFVRFVNKPAVQRDALGRIVGRGVTPEIIERREQLRLAMREANELGPPRVKPSTLPPLDIQARPAADLSGNRATVERGVQRWNSKLTEDDVRSIRADYAAGGITQKALAARHGVHLMLINGIVHRTRWRHVPDIPSEGDN